eukprot:gene8542-10139_t
MRKAADLVSESGNVVAKCAREIMRGKKTACEIESNHADISEQRVTATISRTDIA